MATTDGDDGGKSHLDDEYPRSKVTGELLKSKVVEESPPELDEEEMESGLGNILRQKSLKWIFVGGKGGVGKTTCSCSLSVLLSKVRDSVLLISTDPAHNISDAFDQKFTKYPVMVRGYDNLYAMEIDPAVTDPDEIENKELGEEDKLGGFLKELVSDFAGSVPGIDETKSFMEVMTLVKELHFSVVVFDTAPTGHTIRFLSMPNLFLNGMNKIAKLKSLSGFFQQLMPSLGAGGLSSKFSELLPVIEQINHEFRDPDKATFICVCIAEFLSLYETERLIQVLTKLKIDVGNIVVNQLIEPEKDESGAIICKMCESRHKIQSKYLDQILELYEDFHLTKCPLLTEEVRGRERVEAFSKFLLPNT